MGDAEGEEDHDERQHLQFDCYQLYKHYVSEETKLKQPIGDKIVIKGIGLARLDTFPPPDFEEWASRTTQEDIARAKMEEEKRQELLRQKAELRAKKRAEKEERRKKRKEKKQRKLRREFKMQEVRGSKKRFVKQIWHICCVAF